MRAQHQKFFHKPEDDIWGDCHRTAIAMLLDMDRDDVPHFGFRAADADTFNARVDAWLTSVGFTQITVPYSGTDLDTLLTHLDSINGPGLVYLLGGKSPRGEFNHTVVAGNGRILLDPHPDNTGVVGPCIDSQCYFVTFVVRRDFVRRAELGSVQLALPLPATG